MQDSQTAGLHTADVSSVVWVANGTVNTAVTLLIGRVLTFPEVMGILDYPTADLMMGHFCLSFQCNRQTKAIQNLPSCGKKFSPTAEEIQVVFKGNKSKREKSHVFENTDVLHPFQQSNTTIIEGFLMCNRRCSVASKKAQIFNVGF